MLFAKGVKVFSEGPVMVPVDGVYMYVTRNEWTPVNRPGMYGIFLCDEPSVRGLSGARGRK